MAASVVRLSWAFIAATIQAGGLRALNTVLPPRCLACGIVVDMPHSLCGTCWRGVDFIQAPHCDVCGLPFEIDVGADTLCGPCATEKPPFDHARAAMRYGGVARDLVLALKHGDRTDTAPGLARLMASAGGPLLVDADACVPVPLHRWRLARRRFNQAALLARALVSDAGIELIPDALRRIRRTPSQGGLSRLARQRNVRGAFQLDPRARIRIEGRGILLVDDVYTTGATVMECARVLRRGGARSVDVLTLARVLREGAEAQVFGGLTSI